MDEIEQEMVATAGERLRAAREAQGMSLEEIASSTRIPTRHLASLESGDWSSLPAPTYSIGFAKNYASAVGLDRDEIGDQLRQEMGGSRPIYAPSEVFEPADPKRVMPKGLVIGTILALAIVAIGLTWWQNRAIADDGSLPPAEAAAEGPAAPIAPAPPATSGPVVITANDAAWIEVRDGATVLRQGELAAGQSFEVPATATAPVLTTGKPEALRISVGTADAPAIGPAGRRVSRVSLKAEDLLRGPAQATAAPPVSPAPTPRTTRSAPRPEPAVVAPAAPTVEPAPPPPAAPTSNTAG